MDVSGGAVLRAPRIVIVRDVPEYTPSRGPKPFSSPPPMLGSPVVGELGHRAGSQIADVHARTHAAYPPAFPSESAHFPGESFSAGGPEPSMKANSATLGYFREGTVISPWPPAATSQAFQPAQHAAGHPRVAEQHQFSPAAGEGKKKQVVPGKRISAILGYELDDRSTKAQGITYYSQERWKHVSVSDNFLDVRPEDEVEPTGCTAWIFEYSTDFSTSGMNWRNNRNEIMFHLRRNPDKFAPDRNRLVMNSCTEPSGFYKMLLGAVGIPQSWGREEYVKFSPADFGDNIHLRKIAVCVDDDGFHVAWGGKVQVYFKHRLPWSSFQNFEVDPKWEKWEKSGDRTWTEKRDRTWTEKKSMTLQSMLNPESGIFQEPYKGSNTLFDKESRGSGHLRVATWDGKERTLLTVEDTQKSKVKVGNIKEFICSVLGVPEISKQEFDKWYNLRRTHQWHTIFPVISSNSKEKQDILKVARENCEVLLALHEERVLLELVLENSKPLLVSVVFSGVIRQYAREEQSRDHRRANSANVLAAVLENLMCSIVRRVQLTEAAGSQQQNEHRSRYTRTAVDEHMNEVLEFATTHKMKSFISEPVIVALVNIEWSDTNFAAEDFLKFSPDFLNPYQYQNTVVQCFLTPFFIIHVIVWVLPMVLLTSSWAPVWRFWAFQASYLTYAMLGWYLPRLCIQAGWKKSLTTQACLENGQADDDCCGVLHNLI
jgi:hypothetical protein